MEDRGRKEGKDGEKGNKRGKGWGEEEILL